MRRRLGRTLFHLAVFVLFVCLSIVVSHLVTTYLTVDQPGAEYE